MFPTLSTWLLLCLPFCLVQGLGPSAQDHIVAHNKRRCLHGSSDLVWSRSLETAAQKYADKCIFEHEMPPLYGENLWAGYFSPTAEDGQWGWYTQELPKYDFNKPGFAPDTGHMTQVIYPPPSVRPDGTQQLRTTWWARMQRVGKAGSEQRRSVGSVRDTCGTLACTICRPRAHFDFGVPGEKNSAPPGVCECMGGSESLPSEDLPPRPPRPSTDRGVGALGAVGCNCGSGTPIQLSTTNLPSSLAYRYIGFSGTTTQEGTQPLPGQSDGLTESVLGVNQTGDSSLLCTRSPQN